jgi:hypothetical protein
MTSASQNHYIDIKVSKDPISFDTLKLLPRQELHYDWHGAPLTKPFRWHLTKTGDYLYCLIELPSAASDNRIHSAGAFVEGLWEGDLVELFIGEANTPKYQEWNLSADGAWWAMNFNDYRERDTDSTIPQGIELFIQTEGNNSSWIGCLKIPLSSLRVPLSEESKVHITGIIYSKDNDTNNQPIYLTSSAPQKGAPDFHLSRCFKRLSWGA